MGGQRFSLDTRAEFVKVDESLGLVFGFAAVCTEDGKPFFDKGSKLSSDEEHVPEETMLRAATEFMLGARHSTDSHARDAKGAVVPDGQVVFAFPLTTEVAKALGIKTKRTGLLVGMKPSPEVLAKCVAGEHRGFSIGGTILEDQVLDGED